MALFALLLAVRSLAPLGFMPAFDHGSVTIVACPDTQARLMPVMRHHHQANHGIGHQPCPYGAASALGALGPDLTPLLLPTSLFVLALLLGHASLSPQRQRGHERPPAIGPPRPA